MSDIYNIIDKTKLDVVNKPISEAHGLPNECYTSKEYTKIERKKLFEDKWVVIGAASSLPNIGDTKPFDLLDLPILIIRDSDNKIKVFTGNKWIYQDKDETISDLVDGKYFILDNHYDNTQSNLIKYEKFRKIYDEGDKLMIEALKKQCELVLLNNR